MIRADCRVLMCPALAAAWLSFAGPATTRAEPSAEAEVRAAVLDYVDALYLADPTRVERSVSPSLAKYGVSYGQDGATRWSSMTFQQLADLSARYNASGASMADQPRVVEVLGVESRIASARLEARWGVDYLLLAKDDDGKWRIRQVIWEGRSPTAR